MMLKPIARQMAMIFGGLVAGTAGYVGPASAQQTGAQAAPSLNERVTITGSNVRRTDTETVQPVTVITREQIERTGQSTVADVLRAIPSNTTGSYNETFTNSFASGASGISLRGLGQKATLVLINGRRVAGYGFAQNLQDTFVDLNSIPSAAVERIEVLRDGASAIYGSDAIAGVVNVILRRDFRGFEAAATAGTSYEGDSTEYRTSLAAGFGDLGSQKFNLFGVIDVYKRDGIVYADRPLQSNRDFRGRPGGTNNFSLTGGGTWQDLLASGAPGFQRRAHAECPTDKVVNYQQAAALGLISDTRFDLAGNTWCMYDLSKEWTAVPATERIGFLGRGNFEFSESLAAYAEIGVSKNKTEQSAARAFFGTTGLRQTASGSLAPFAYNVNVAPGVGGNPFGAGTNARYVGNITDVGLRDREVTSDSLRALVGLKGAHFGFDWDTAVGWSKNEVEQADSGRLSQPGFNTALGLTIPPFPTPVGVPIATSSLYNFNNPSTNSQAVRDQVRANFSRFAESELEFFDMRGNTELGMLPGGPVGLAVGVEYRHESLTDRPPEIARTGGVLGQGITATDGSRHNVAVFTELALPLTRTIEAQAALRSDHYSDFGSALTPKVGFKFKPAPEFLVRANWGRGFRAPTLPEISPSVATFFVSVIDTALCDFNPTAANCTGASTSGVFAGNPNLKAEQSRSFNLGTVWEPNNTVSVGVEYFNIKWTNLVGSLDFQDIVDANDPNQVIRDAPTPTNPFGPIVTVLSNFINRARVDVSGTEFDVAYRFRNALGRWVATLNAAYTHELIVDGTQYAGNNNNGPGNTPRWKGYADMNWDQGPWAVTGRVNYIHGYNQVSINPSLFAPANPISQPVAAERKLPSQTTYDLFARYRITSRFSVSASVRNITNEQPPFDPSQTLTFFDFQTYDYRGRMYSLGIKFSI